MNKSQHTQPRTMDHCYESVSSLSIWATEKVGTARTTGSVPVWDECE